MEVFDGKGAARFVSDYIEREVHEIKKMTEGESLNGAPPAAVEAFNRKPCYNITGMSFKCRPRASVSG